MTQHTAFSCTVYCRLLSCVTGKCSSVTVLFRPNSGQLIYHNMKGFICSIDAQNSMDS